MSKSVYKGEFWVVSGWWYFAVIAFFALGIFLGAIMFWDTGGQTAVHERTVIHYVTETRQTEQTKALGRCWAITWQEADNGSTPVTYAKCVGLVEKAFSTP